MILPKGVGDKDFKDSLKVHIGEWSVKLDIESLLANDAITAQMRKIKRNYSR